MKNSYLLVILFLFFFINMQGQNSRNIKLLNRDSFESIIDGKKVSLYTLKNNKGTITEITNYGGRVVSLWVKDKNGNYEDIVLGFSNIQGYINSKEKYFGAIIGRYANRINKGKFILNEKEYQLALNNGENHLHGGKKGYESIVWKAKQIDNQTLELTHYSKHMEEGYPGNLNIKVS